MLSKLLLRTAAYLKISKCLEYGKMDKAGGFCREAIVTLESGRVRFLLVQKEITSAKF